MMATAYSHGSGVGSVGQASPAAARRRRTAVPPPGLHLQDAIGWCKRFRRVGGKRVSFYVGKHRKEEKRSHNAVAALHLVPRERGALPAVRPYAPSRTRWWCFRHVHMSFVLRVIRRCIAILHRRVSWGIFGPPQKALLPASTPHFHDFLTGPAGLLPPAGSEEY